MSGDDTLTDELAALSAFLRLLEAERQALVANDAASVGRIAAEKKQMLVSLQQCAQQRLNAKPRPLAHASTSTSTRKPVNADAVRDAWLKAQRLNQLNEDMLRMHAVRVERALNVLRQAVSGPTTYGARGYLAGAFLFAPVN